LFGLENQQIGDDFQFNPELVVPPGLLQPSLPLISPLLPSLMVRKRFSSGNGVSCLNNLNPSFLALMPVMAGG
jgi:hypothetical protein